VLELAAIILLPMVFGSFLLVGSVALSGEQHPAFKIFLFLMSLLSYFLSSWVGMLVAVEYHATFTALQDFLGWSAWLIGSVWVICVVYFVIYLIASAFKAAAQEKSERLEY
jgi:hypothetical protein